jgi:hypothetical protein
VEGKEGHFVKGELQISQRRLVAAAVWTVRHEQRHPDAPVGDPACPR